jgi:hypothetical protein
LEKTVWNVGDACFIAEMKTDPRFVQMRVMPAVVVQIFDDEGTRARAEAYTKDMCGPHTAEGQPFVTEEAARAYLAEYSERVRTAYAQAKLHGERPEWQLPANAPRQGSVVYTIDVDRKEILEAVVGIVRIEHGRMEVAYDECPGNPEASNIRMKRWWKTQREAASYAKQHHQGIVFTFVSKENLAARVGAEIEQVWVDAIANLKSRRFKKWLKKLGALLRKL